MIGPLSLNLVRCSEHMIKLYHIVLNGKMWGILFFFACIFPIFLNIEVKVFLVYFTHRFKLEEFYKLYYKCTRCSVVPNSWVPTTLQMFPSCKALPFSPSSPPFVGMSSATTPLKVLRLKNLPPAVSPEAVNSYP